VYSTQNLKMFPLHCIPEILYAESIYTDLIIRAKSFSLWPNAYPQYIHYEQKDGQETRRRWYHWCLQHSCNLKSVSKIVYSIGLIINVGERKFHANFDVENKVPGNESS